MRYSTSSPLQTPAQRVARAAALAICSFLLVGAAATARAQSVAVVADKAGEVWLDTTGLPQPVALLDYLNAGTRIKLGNAGRLAILYLQTGYLYTAEGPGLVEVTPAQLSALIGTAPQLQTPPTGKEIRLKPGRVALGGIVMRSMKPLDTAAASGAQPTPVSAAVPVARPAATPADSKEIEQRRPSSDASYAARVAFALWLEEAGVAVEAQQAWRALSAERPADAALARRAQ